MAFFAFKQDSLLEVPAVDWVVSGGDWLFR
jgi:hypothetical protein